MIVTASNMPTYDVWQCILSDPSLYPSPPRVCLASLATKWLKVCCANLAHLICSVPLGFHKNRARNLILWRSKLMVWHLDDNSIFSLLVVLSELENSPGYLEMIQVSLRFRGPEATEVNTKEANKLLLIWPPSLVSNASIWRVAPADPHGRSSCHTVWTCTVCQQMRQRHIWVSKHGRSEKLLQI